MACSTCLAGLETNLVDNRMYSTNYLDPEMVKFLSNTNIHSVTNFYPDNESMTNWLWATNIITTNFSAICFTNSGYFYLARFEPLESYTKTNIVINTSFTGTIQVGTNFYHMVSQTNTIVERKLSI